MGFLAINLAGMDMLVLAPTVGSSSSKEKASAEWPQQILNPVFIL
jgi:hypothetical protein